MLRFRDFVQLFSGLGFEILLNFFSEGQMKTFKLEVPKERERERKKERKKEIEMNVMMLPGVNMYDESAHLRERERERERERLTQE